MNRSRHHHRVADPNSPTVYLHDWDVSPAEARRIQADLAARVDLNDAIAIDAIEIVAGVDNTYVTRAGKTTAGAVVVALTFPAMEIMETVVAWQPIVGRSRNNPRWDASPSRRGWA